jgi:chromosome segregation ATPase
LFVGVCEATNHSHVCDIARIKSESEKYHNASREAAELRQQLNESEARKSDLQFRLTQAETLKAEIESTNTWMQRQLEEKSKQLVDLRSEKSTDVFKLQQQLDSTESELRSVQRLHQTVQAQLQERDVEVDRLSVELTNVKQDKASAEASLESKVESLIRVRDLYKDQVQELQDKIAGTSQSHESHRLVLQQLQEQHMQDLEERDEATRKALKDVDTLAKRVADLQQQLDTASSSQVRCQQPHNRKHGNTYRL